MTSCDGEPVMFVCVITRDTYALNQSLEFIRSSLSNLDVASQFECEKGEADDWLIVRYNAFCGLVGVVDGAVAGGEVFVSIYMANDMAKGESIG